MNSHEVFIHIHQGCFAGTGAIVRLPQCQCSKPDGYGKISQCITTTKHTKAKTVCIFLGIYCISPKSCDTFAFMIGWVIALWTADFLILVYLCTMATTPCGNQVEFWELMMTSSNGNIFRVAGEFPTQRLVTWSFDGFFDLRLNKGLGKQSGGWWLETPSHPLWRHCNVKIWMHALIWLQFPDITVHRGTQHLIRREGFKWVFQLKSAYLKLFNIIIRSSE